MIDRRADQTIGPRIAASSIASVAGGLGRASSSSALSTATAVSALTLLAITMSIPALLPGQKSERRRRVGRHES
jgi:hypothetical protein